MLMQTVGTGGGAAFFVQKTQPLQLSLDTTLTPDHLLTLWFYRINSPPISSIILAKLLLIHIECHTEFTLIFTGKEIYGRTKGWCSKVILRQNQTWSQQQQP
jgi:hypothetical protein